MWAKSFLYRTRSRENVETSFPWKLFSLFCARWVSTHLSIKIIFCSAAHNQLLINSTAPKTNEIGHELSIIKSNFGKEIAALKSVVSGDVSKHQRHPVSSIASSSLTSHSVNRKVSSESIKSPSNWNEISFDDKFSKIIDDGASQLRDERSDKRKHLMMNQEIDNASRRNYCASNDANESIGDTSDVMRLPQDDSSFNWMTESVSWIKALSLLLII